VRRSLLLAPVLLAGCLDFDARYADRVDAGACRDLLCHVLTYQGTDLDVPDLSYFGALDNLRVSAGIVATSLDEVVVYASTANTAVSYDHTHVLFHLTDAGVRRLDVTQQLEKFNRGMAAVGTPRRFWAVSYGQSVRFVDLLDDLAVPNCASRLGSQWGAYQRGEQEVYFTGQDLVCKWTGGATATQIFPSGLHEESYLNAAWASSTGELYVGGGGSGDGGEYDSHVYLLDGGEPPIPVDQDPELYGVMALSGAGADVWAASRTGRIFKRQADGSFATVYDAQYTLFDLEVVAPDDIWAVGDKGRAIIHFDGAAWSQVPLDPPVGTTTRWERVHGVPGGLVLAGATDNPDAGGNNPLIRLYRRGR
jgi:hypothetical protein